MKPLAAFVFGFMLAIALTVLMGATVPQTRDYHRRACISEFKRAKTGADSILVVVADDYCTRFARGEGGAQ